MQLASVMLCLSVLAELGVLYWKLDADNWQTDPELKQIRQDRGYTYEVSCISELTHHISHCVQHKHRRHVVRCFKCKSVT